MIIRKKIFSIVKLQILLIIFLLFNDFIFSQDFKKITIQKVLSIGSIENDILYQWADVCVDDNGNIYLTDMLDYSIKKFNKNGKLIKKTGRKGMGPGEFNDIRFIRLYKKRLYITEQYKRSIQVFDTSLHYRYSIPFDKAISDIQILSENKIAIPEVIENNIQIIDTLGNTKEVFSYRESKNKNNFDFLDLFSNMIKFKFDVQKNLYVCYSFNDKIAKYKSNNKLEWNKKLFKGAKQTYHDSNVKEHHTQLPQNIFYKNIEFDTSGNVFVLGGHYSENKSRDVYVLSQKGEHITTFTLPDETHCIYIDKENYLYSRAKQGVILKKYKIIYN